MDIVYISFVFLINGCMAQISIVTSPINQAVVAGGNVNLECKVEQPLQTGYVSWSECITKTDNCPRISNDMMMVYEALGGDGFRADRYSISNPQTGQFDLKVTGTVWEEDAGKYKCSAQNSDGLERTAELILLDGEFVYEDCTRNTTIPNEAKEGDIIRFVCEKAYRGRWAPVVVFDENGSVLTNENDESSTEVAKYSFSITVLPAQNQQIYGARLYFKTPNDTGTNEATNTPDYSRRITFPPLTVFYKPNTVQITMDGDCQLEGMFISCNAFGNPPPSYEWRDMNTSEIISTGKVLTVTEEMLGSNTYSCRAFNNIGEAMETVSFDVCTDGGKGPGTGNTKLGAGPIAGIAVGVVVVVAVIIVILVCCCRKDKEKQKQANETRPNMTRGPDVIRSPDSLSNVPPKPALPPPYPDEKVGHDPGPYDPYGRSGPYDVEVPPYDSVDNEDPKNRNVENLTYADLALEDIPRSRKPIQVLDPTEYAEIRRV